MKQLVLSLGLLVAAGAFGMAAEGQQPDFGALLKKADSLVSFMDTDFSASYTFDQVLPGEDAVRTKQAIIFRRDKDNTYTMVMISPKSDKGVGYLKSDNKLWLYDPVSRRFVLTSAKDRFQNLNARNSDFTRSNLASDYKPVSGVRQKLGAFDCWVLDLEARSDDITFPRMRIWISDDNLVRKTEDYSLSGQSPVRITAFPTYRQLEGRFIPNKIVITDLLKGAMVKGKFKPEVTSITIDRPTLGRQPDSTFSKTYLETLSE